MSVILFLITFKSVGRLGSVNKLRGGPGLRRKRKGSGQREETPGMAYQWHIKRVGCTGGRARLFYHSKTVNHYKEC
jgi:hypothetical protein